MIKPEEYLMELKSLKSGRSELHAEFAPRPVTVEAKFLSDLIRENRELKQACRNYFWKADWIRSESGNAD